jgi:hypothetical protein
MGKAPGEGSIHFSGDGSGMQTCRRTHSTQFEKTNHRPNLWQTRLLMRAAWVFLYFKTRRVGPAAHSGKYV